MLDQLEHFIKTLGGYDLHQTLLGTLSITGWNGFPVEHYRYEKIDPDGTRKVGEVALLDPSAEQLAAWISTAVEHATGGRDLAKAKSLARHCRDQSGFQFPVRGIHWENLTPIFKAYTFFDGVTVRLQGWNPSWPTTPLQQSELDAAMGASWDDVDEARLYARIQGTNREEYLADGGTLPTKDKEWLKVARQLYQAAWGGEQNILMNAKAKSLLG